jgi:hypothetical protein
VSDSSDPHARLADRVHRLEDDLDDLVDRLATERASRKLLERDVRWVVRLAMGAAAVVSAVISLAAQYLMSL